MKKKILIIDDEESFGKTAKLSLEKAGEYEVKTELKGTNGLAAAKEFRPDLIFLDVIMPDMDGGEVARQIKSDDSVKNTPIVFVTAALTKEEAGPEGEIIAGHPFIAKPVSVKELINCIEENVK